MTKKKYLSKIEDLSNRKIVLTGGTSGIGLSFLKYLVSKNAFVILLVRNIKKAETIVKELNYSNIDIIEYDQSSYSSIKKGIDTLLEKYPSVDSIVLNAGVMSRTKELMEGHPYSIGVNYYGVRYFIEYIAPKLTAKTKIIVQGSLVAGFHLNKKTNIDSNDFKTFKEYNISKMCVEAYTYKLMKEKPYSNIDFVLTEPGITSTSITRDLDSFLKHVGKVFVSTFFHSVDKASLTLLEAVSSKATHGSYIVPRGLFTISGYPKYKKFPHKREREYLIK